MTTGVQPKTPLLVRLTDGLIPLDREGKYIPNHVDEHGIVHWFSVVEAAEADHPLHQLRYFRATRADDGRLIHDSHPVMPLEPSSAPPFPLLQLQEMLENGELLDAQEIAYQAARLHGLPFPEPEHLPDLPARGAYRFSQPEPEAPVLSGEQPAEGAFFEADGEVDTWSLVPNTVEPDRAVQQFQNWFAGSPHRLLEPLDPVVNYSFNVALADPWTLELSANKWWFDAHQNIVHNLQPLSAYSLESFEFEREIERERASMDRELLEHTYREQGLEAVMRQAEAMAVANQQLDPNRADGRLFAQGPPDRFTTLREAELAGLDAHPVQDTWRDIRDDDTQELPTAAPEPGSWEALLAQHNGDESEPERHYWQIHYRPVQTPDGEPLGTALFLTEFPQLPLDFDEFVEEYGMDNSIYPTEARTLEMAHFASDEDARKFEAEFRSSLMPDLLDGPELAPEVAKLEGLSGAWENIDYWGIVDYMSGNRIIVREVEDWHLHNPNIERGAGNPDWEIEY